MDKKQNFEDIVQGYKDEKDLPAENIDLATFNLPKKFNFSEQSFLYPSVKKALLKYGRDDILKTLTGAHLGGLE